MKTTTRSSLLAAALLIGGATGAQAQAPSDTQERNASPLDPPTERAPDARVAPEARDDANAAPVTPLGMPPLANPPPSTVPVTANGTRFDGSPPVTEPDPSAPGSYDGPRLLNRVGAGLLIGGGFEDFTNSNLRSMTTGGGFWNARLVAGTHQVIGVEAAYTGAARGIDALGLGQNARLVSNGAEGALRGNLPIRVGRSLLEPFVLVGLGWQHYNLTNTDTNTSDVASRDDIMTLPVGTGFEYSYGRFLADARIMYRQTYYNDLLRTSGGNLNNLSVGTQVGLTF
jgi:hypothetical protein